MNWTQCNDNLEDCEWNNDGNHCRPKAVGGDCYMYTMQGNCDGAPGCDWNAPDWMDPWQLGACMTLNACLDPLNNNEGSCNNAPGCEWNWDNYKCEESGSGDNYCDCWITHTKRSCEDIGGSWELPPWAMAGDDFYECMIPLDQSDCYHNYEDVCNQFFAGSNEFTTWDGTTCTKTFSFSESGTWSANATQFCMNWEEQPQQNCADLNTMDECYCLDCEWSPGNGVCQPWPTAGGRLGRTQYQMHKYQQIIMQLSSSNAEDCYSFGSNVTVNSNGVVSFDDFYTDDWGYPVCDKVVLTPSTSAPQIRIRRKH